MPQIKRILETALYVEDLERSESFYQSIFEFEVLFSDQRLCAMSVLNQQVLLLFLKGASTVATVIPGGVIPPTDGDGQMHLAFAIEPSELTRWEKWLAENNVEIESTVKWERGGTSLYFRDPDGNLLELATPGLWAIY